MLRSFGATQDKNGKNGQKSAFLGALMNLDVVFNHPLRIFLKVKNGMRGSLAVTATPVRANK
jgi:hypothetical protein